jgi:hypothetical protein
MLLHFLLSVGSWRQQSKYMKRNEKKLLVLQR